MTDSTFKELVAERFKKLPKVVQDAITSTDVSRRMRELADTHKLHLDQWESLESEVQLTLLGIQPSEDLRANIKSEVGVDDETAASLTKDISRIVFEPIRQELERQLEHPDAQAEMSSDIDQMRTQMLADSTAPVATGTAVAPVIPATPPAPAPTAKVERTAIAAGYDAAAASHERKTVAGDPYREQIA